MPTGADHIPDDGSGIARTLRVLGRRLDRLEAAPRASAIVALTPWANLALPGDWTPAGDPWALPRGRRLPTTGAVQLIGSLVPGTLTAGTVIAQLPAGQWPSADLEFRVGGGTATATVDLTITAAAGTIAVQSTTGTVTRISLTQISIPG